MHGGKTFVLIFLSLLSFNTFSVSEGDIQGLWLTDSKKAVVKIFKDKNQYSGKLVWLFRIATGLKKDIFDDKNPDENLQKRSLQNLINLWGFSFDGDEWVDGKIYDPNSGKTYSAKMSLADKRTLKLRGYVGIPLFGKTATWTRVDSLKGLPSK